jgi:protein transport protein SEC24
MKVRCSNGLQVSAYHGNFIHHTFGADLEFGVIDADKALGVTFSYDGKLDPKQDAHFQSALLYTTAGGERRVRCSNIVANVAENTRDSMRFVDQDAVVNIIAKEGTKLCHSLSHIILTLLQQQLSSSIAHLKRFEEDYRKRILTSWPAIVRVLWDRRLQVNLCYRRTSRSLACTFSG